MKVFISHSGDRSRTLADKMNWFVGNLLQATEPWVSTGIDKGARWEPEIAQNLQAAAIGIVCLTSDNLEKPWILFEAGALAKQLDGKVCTLLLDIEKEQVKPPLSQFQATKAERDEVWDLITTINKATAKPRPDGDLRESFEFYWPKLEEAITDLRKRAPTTPPQPRKQEEMIAELLDITKEIGRATGVQENTLHLVRRIYETVVEEKPTIMEEWRRALLLRDVAKLEPSNLNRYKTLYDLAKLGSEAASKEEGVATRSDSDIAGEAR